MKRLIIFLCAVSASAQSKVDFEMMTWPEVKQAIEAGKTTALIYNGGTEQRGPQNVNGGHTLMGHATVIAIAEKLGNAIAAPVLPFSVNNANPAMPGTIGLTGPLFAAINEQVAEQMIKNGFKHIVLMGDHGGGQNELGEVAKKLDSKYDSQGIRVVFCDEVYKKANADFDKWLEANHLPVSSHAGIPDTSEMLYLGGDKGWVRKELVATGRAKGSEREARQQRDSGRRATFDGGAGQEDFRYESRRSGRSDPSVAALRGLKRSKLARGDALQRYNCP
jgi:creatinine amidohydrolase/Fe(II)-dependent formamide hydrolase-like protein